MAFLRSLSIFALETKNSKDMKHLFPVLLFIVLSLSASADYFTIGNLYYEIIDNDNVMVKGHFSILSGALTIPASVTYNRESYSVISIGSEAFRFCSGLTSVTIPNSVTSIGTSAFYDCSGLTSVTIGTSVTSIGGYAFAGCSGLTSVTIPNSVTEIGGGAFYGCSGLTSVTIPNSVTSIDGYAFC